MKAVQFRSPGEPREVLRCTEAAVPEPGFGEVRVRMIASPVNPSDLMFVRGNYTVPAELPACPGFEGVGIVERSGGGLRGRLFQGKRVAVLNRNGGNWAAYAVVPAQQVIPLSRALSTEQAATFFVNPATAWVMTQEVLKVPRGAWLLQTAASSALGRMIIRLGVRQGFRTINIVRRESHVSDLKRLGADAVVVFDESTENPAQLTEAVRQVTGGGVRYAMDPVGGATTEGVVGCLGHQGHLLIYGTLSGDPIHFLPRQLMSVGARIEGFWLGNYMDGISLPSKLMLVRKITRLILEGVLTSEIRGTWELQDVADAVTAAESPGQTGKVILKLDS